MFEIEQDGCRRCCVDRGATKAPGGQLAGQRVAVVGGLDREVLDAADSGHPMELSENESCEAEMTLSAHGAFGQIRGGTNERQGAD